jgi:hypothetical protein
MGTSQRAPGSFRRVVTFAAGAPSAAGLAIGRGLDARASAPARRARWGRPDGLSRHGCRTTIGAPGRFSCGVRVLAGGNAARRVAAATWPRTPPRERPRRRFPGRHARAAALAPGHGGAPDAPCVRDRAEQLRASLPRRSRRPRARCRARPAPPPRLRRRCAPGDRGVPDADQTSRSVGPGGREPRSCASCCHGLAGHVREQVAERSRTITRPFDPVGALAARPRRPSSLVAVPPPKARAPAGSIAATERAVSPMEGAARLAESTATRSMGVPAPAVAGRELGAEAVSGATSRVPRLGDDEARGTATRDRPPPSAPCRGNPA